MQGTLKKRQKKKKKKKKNLSRQNNLNSQIQDSLN